MQGCFACLCRFVTLPVTRVRLASLPVWCNVLFSFYVFIPKLCRCHSPAVVLKMSHLQTQLTATHKSDFICMFVGCMCEVSHEAYQCSPLYLSFLCPFLKASENSTAGLDTLQCQKQICSSKEGNQDISIVLQLILLLLL